ncbi:hypothetical protein [Amycolatopsis sp. lyj-109]|uniref:hypothetical protein n=1 Tax=Amycolatopsis sp. lyj-109 TaxID=2789287 RepID=UPI00397B44E2
MPGAGTTSNRASANPAAYALPNAGVVVFAPDQQGRDPDPRETAQQVRIGQVRAGVGPHRGRVGRIRSRRTGRRLRHPHRVARDLRADRVEQDEPAQPPRRSG